MKSYNGHRSWNAWNVSLWLNGNEETYYLWNWMPQKLTLEGAVEVLRMTLPKKTPDGADYNRLSIKLAIQELWENQDD
jgi:hypothetical protein